MVDEKWMRHALELAKQAENIGEVPVGAVVVLDGKIIGRGYNMPICKKSPMAHAEILALEAAAGEIENYRILDSVVYVTLEPCLMCYGAMVHARVNKCVFGAKDPKSGVVSCGVVDVANKYVNHKVTIIGGVFEKESSRILKDFFKQKRSNR